MKFLRPFLRHATLPGLLPVLLLTMALALNACVEEIEPEGPVIASIDEAIVAMGEATSQNKVVTQVEQDRHIYQLSFSDGSTPLVISADIIEQAFQNVGAWRLEVSFTDGQTGTLYLQGNRIGIIGADVDLDPNNRTPLAALANFNTPIPCHIRVVVPGRGTDGIAIAHTFTRASTQYVIPVLGLYAGHDNPVEFHLLDVSGNELAMDVVTITTEAINSGPTITIAQNQLPATEDQVYMEVGLKYAFDQRGELRWLYRNGIAAQFYDRLPNGNWIASNNTNQEVYHFAEINEISMLGNTLRSYRVPHRGHHEVRVVDNGAAYLVGTNSVPMLIGGYGDEGTLQEDAAIEIDAANGTATNEIDYNLVLDNTREPIVFQQDDWFHLNSIDLDPGPDATSGTADDGIISSGRHQAAVVKTNRNTGELVWILGAHEQWPEHLQPFLLTPVDEAGNALDITGINFWPYGQHSAIVLPNRNVLMYDNGTARGFYKEEPRPENEYTRAVEYKIDEAAMTIQKVWEYDHGKQIFTIATGDIDYLPATNGRLISFMWQNPLGLATPRIVELDENSNVVFEYVINGGGGRYRTDKFDLYEGID